MKKLLTLSLACLIALMIVTRSATRTPAAAATPPVVVVMLENHEDVSLTKAKAPYLFSLKAAGRYFSNYTSVIHPSLPNYLAAVSGSTQGKHGDPISAGEIPGDNLWNQLTSIGSTWGVYEELMPSVCFPGRSYVVTSPSKDMYGNGHNPGSAFANIYNSSQCQNVKPLTQMPTTLPAVSWVTPSYCNDMHGFNDATYPADCQVNTPALMTRGDSWLHTHVDQWRAEGAIVIVTFDEGSTATGGGGRVFTVEVGPGIQPSVDSAAYDHYSLLAGIEDGFGLPRLNNAVGAVPLPIPSGSPPPDTTPPTQPGKPSGVGAGTTSISLSWAASTDVSPPINYRIYRDGGSTPVGSTTATTFVDSGLTSGSSHTYTVDAVDAASNVSAMSVASDPIVAKPPPTNVFSDAFATGSFSAWTSNTRMTIDNSQGGVAVPSAKMNTSGQSASAYKDLPVTLQTVCMSANVKVAALNGTALDLLRLRSAGNAPATKAFVSAAGKLAIRSDYSSVQKISTTSLPSGWHSLELCGTAGPGRAWDLYLDGSKAINGWVTGTDPAGITRVQIGDTAAKTVIANWDDVVVDQTPG